MPGKHSSRWDIGNQGALRNAFAAVVKVFAFTDNGVCSTNVSSDSRNGAASLVHEGLEQRLAIRMQELATNHLDETEMTMSAPYTIYFAGHLFDHKDLAGNALLGAQIDDASAGRFKCVLPQDLEQRDIGPMGIRDQDLNAVVECDLALFNFDGSELGSGAVVEYMYAKMLDIPTVILRTDFRHGATSDPTPIPGTSWCRFFRAPGSSTWT